MQFLYPSSRAGAQQVDPWPECDFRVVSATTMRWLAGRALCVLILTTSCGGSNEEATPSSTSSPTTSTTVTEAPTTTLTTTTTTTTTEAPATTTAPDPSDEDQILDVVTRFWDVIVEANNPPDPDSPLWETVATGQALEGVREQSKRWLEERSGLRHPTPRQEQLSKVEILVLEDSVAVVDVCLRDDGILHNIDTGAVLNDEIIHLWIQVYALHEDRWLVTEVQTIAEFDQEAACAGSF